MAGVEPRWGQVAGVLVANKKEPRGLWQRGRGPQTVVAQMVAASQAARSVGPWKSSRASARASK